MPPIMGECATWSLVVHAVRAQPAGRSMKLMLTMANGSPETWCRDITSQPVVLGRDESADIRLDHRSVSRQHCRFWGDEHGCYVKDCLSMNGVYVNGKRIEKCQLNSGDRLLIGKFELLVATETEVRDTIEGSQLETADINPHGPAEELRHLARTVHQRLTPSGRIGLPGLLVEVAYRPSGLLGGDSFLCLEMDRRWVLVVLDSMYHGTKSALALTLLRNELGRCIELTSQPARCLEWLNTELSTLGIPDLYTCACIATWFPDTQLLYYGTAGLGPPVVLRKNRPVNMPESAGGLPLGVNAAEQYDESLIQLKHQDRFFLFSDGIRALFSPRANPVSRQITASLLRGQSLDLEAQIGQLLGDADDEIYDDLLIVGAEVTVKM